MKHPWDPRAFRQGAIAAGRDVSVIHAGEIAARLIKQVDPNFPVILTLSHLGFLVDIAPGLLREIVDRKTDPYRTFRLKKRGSPGRGSARSRPFRTICVPEPALMKTQRWIAQNILNVAKPHDSSYAFAPGRSLMGAADRHAGCKWLVKLDVHSFFESIKEPSVYRLFRTLGYGELVSFELTRLCTRQDTLQVRSDYSVRDTVPYWRRRPPGYLPQGAPTSPMLANLVVRDLDIRLNAIAQRYGWIYTRYADDLAFSTTERSSRGQAMHVASLAEREMSAFGLSSNRQKTTVIPAGSRKILLGVLVDGSAPNLTRAFRNNLETHLYALTHAKIGPAAHRSARGFASIIGMRRHIECLLAFAHQVNSDYARRLYEQFNRVDWTA
jgi:RNA-directed DNA polymerase